MVRTLNSVHKKLSIYNSHKSYVVSLLVSYFIFPFSLKRYWGLQAKTKEASSAVTGFLEEIRQLSNNGGGVEFALLQTLSR